MSVHDRKNLKSALESAILYLQKQGVEEARQAAGCRVGISLIRSSASCREIMGRMDTLSLSTGV